MNVERLNISFHFFPLLFTPFKVVIKLDAASGQVGEYIDRKEDIASYIERVQLYFAVNLRSCYVSSVNWSRCIWCAEDFVST